MIVKTKEGILQQVAIDEYMNDRRLLKWEPEYLNRADIVKKCCVNVKMRLLKIFFIECRPLGHGIGNIVLFNNNGVSK